MSNQTEQERGNHSDLTLDSAIFEINGQPFCVWDVGMKRRTLDFLRSLDSEYFHYMATTHANGLENEQTLRKASIALRSAYYQALETFSLLVGAMLQAPHCEYAYVLKADNYSLRSLMGKLCSGEPFYHCYQSKEAMTWKRISTIIHQKIDVPNREIVINKFADCWSRLGHDFLNENHIREYNSLKHGFRVMSGGFEIKFGKQSAPSVPCPPNEMESLGKSKYGSTFYAIAGIKGSPVSRKDCHFTTKKISLNWDAENTVNAVAMLSYSINNISSHLRLRNGEDPTGPDFQIPDDPDAFTSPWKNRMRLISADIDFPVTEEDITRHTTQCMKDILNGSMGTD